MTLFDDIKRTYDGPAFHSEPEFTYLNRSARPTVEKIRHIVEDWFSKYPLKERAGLRGDFRSPIDSQHRSAFFELFLHEFLLRLGCRVTIHPDMDNHVTKHPDYLVESPTGSKFYLEAVLATDETDEDVAARARMNEVFDAIDQLDSPNFFIGMDLVGAPKSPPSARKIKVFLAEHLTLLNPDEIAEKYELEGFITMPRWRYEFDGWSITFYPIPKSPRSKGKPGIRSLGLQMFDFKSVMPRIAVRDAILRKAGRYGRLDLPYVIAVNALGKFGVDRIHIMEALFGQEQFTVAFGYKESASEPVMTRAPDGVWTSMSGPRYTRVSAVLVLNPVLAWNLPKAPVRLYHNPWAAKPYNSVLTELPQAIPNDGRIELFDGTDLGQIFNLPTDWPHS